jgi:hypothetical protein
MSLSLGSLFFMGCGPGQEPDPTMNLTGTESQPVVVQGATPTCSSDKVLICHVPPGNPDNAHTICVGQAAVKAHLRNHPDYLGACLAGGDPRSPPPPVSGPQGDGDAGAQVDAGQSTTPTDGFDAGVDAGTGSGGGVIN